MPDRAGEMAACRSGETMGRFSRGRRQTARPSTVSFPHPEWCLCGAARGFHGGISGSAAILWSTQSLEPGRCAPTVPAVRFRLNSGAVGRLGRPSVTEE